MANQTSLKELFPNWNKLKRGESVCLSISGIQRPLQYLNCNFDESKDIKLFLEKQENGDYIFTITDSQDNLYESILDKTLTKEVIYDKNNNRITIDNDHENEEGKAAYDKFLGR